MTLQSWTTFHPDSQTQVALVEMALQSQSAGAVVPTGQKPGPSVQQHHVVPAAPPPSSLSPPPSSSPASSPPVPPELPIEPPELLLEAPLLEAPLLEPLLLPEPPASESSPPSSPGHDAEMATGLHEHLPNAHSMALPELTNIVASFGASGAQSLSQTQGAPRP